MTTKVDSFKHKEDGPITSSSARDHRHGGRDFVRVDSTKTTVTGLDSKKVAAVHEKVVTAAVQEAGKALGAALHSSASTPDLTLSFMKRNDRYHRSRKTSDASESGCNSARSEREGNTAAAPARPHPHVDTESPEVECKLVAATPQGSPTPNIDAGAAAAATPMGSPLIAPRASPVAFTGSPVKGSAATPTSWNGKNLQLFKLERASPQTPPSQSPSPPADASRVGQVAFVGDQISRILFSQFSVAPRTSSGSTLEELEKAFYNSDHIIPAIEVVEMPSGALVSLDNRRLKAAHIAAMNEAVGKTVRVWAKVFPHSTPRNNSALHRNFTKLLSSVPAGDQKHWKVPSNVRSGTYGQAIHLRMRGDFGISHRDLFDTSGEPKEGLIFSECRVRGK